MIKKICLLNHLLGNACLFMLIACMNTTFAKDIKPCETIADKSLPGTPRPFIFNHAHIDNSPWWIDKNKKNQWQPQSVPVNSCVHIQLPGAPTRWFVESLVINGVKAKNSEITQSGYPNQNRYIVPCQKAGVDKKLCPSQIDQFELNILKPGTTVIKIIGNPPALIPEQLAKVQGGFRTYTLTLKVTE